MSIADLLPAEAKAVPELESFSGPVELVRRGLMLPRAPGVYVVASGDCVAHIGTSGNLRSRVGTLAALGTHRGSTEVICAAYCTGEAPQVWWYPTEKLTALVLERDLKSVCGEPPIPRAAHAGCVNGGQLRDDLVAAAGADSWHAGYVEAVFTIGERLRLLFSPKFDEVWASVGVPPGSWHR